MAVFATDEFKVNFGLLLVRGFVFHAEVGKGNLSAHDRQIVRPGDFLPARKLFLGGQRVDLGQLAIDGSLQFKVENHAVDLSSRSRDSFAFVLVEPVDRGIVAGFPSLDEAVIEDLARCCVSRPVAGITKKGGQAIFIKTDVSRASEVNAMVERTVAAYGHVDVLVNNAATGPFKKLLDTNEAEWDQILNTNLKGILLCAQAVIPVMKRNGGGTIVNVGSSLALVAARGIAAYCASKGGVMQISKAMAVEHAEDHIRVNCVCPGPVLTTMMTEYIEKSDDPSTVRELMTEGTLLKRFGQPDEIANVITFMASDLSSFMTGSVVVADGGWTTQ